MIDLVQKHGPDSLLGTIAPPGRRLFRDDLYILTPSILGAININRPQTSVTDGLIRRLSRFFDRGLYSPVVSRIDGFSAVAAASSIPLLTLPATDPACVPRSRRYLVVVRPFQLRPSRTG